MADSSGEKTEEPTQKKIDDSRKKGQVWKSRDLTGALVFLVGLGAIKATWSMVEAEVASLFRFTFDRVAHPEDIMQGTFAMLLMGVKSAVVLTLPVAVAAAILGGLVDFLQVGPLFAFDSLKPKLEKLNPIEGFKNLFSKKQIVEAIKSMLKIGVAGYVVWAVVKDAIGMVVGTVMADLPMTLEVLGELTFRVSVRVGLLFIVFGIFDVWWQRRVYYKDLMMTKDEVKREYKESEGDPHHKAKRKELHMEILEGAQMEAVKGADVVVTNPDHVAVALRYARGDAAPVLVAKGLDGQAEAIKRLACGAGVPILRNVPLARALHGLEVGQGVPEELYDAVAEVVGFVWSVVEARESRVALDTRRSTLD
ncbi:MAG: type III secretion system export apparatus subunit SctU [Myxococcales bacterium]|nr:type III secretion system export apparatus subunit SctU [Myxococcales bacterium]